MVTFHSPFRRTDPVHYCSNRSGPRHTHERPIHRSWTTRFRSHVTTTHFSAIKELKNKPVHAVWTRYVSFSSHLGSDGLTAVCRFDVGAALIFRCQYLCGGPIRLARGLCGQVKVCHGKVRPGATLSFWLMDLSVPLSEQLSEDRHTRSSL